MLISFGAKNYFSFKEWFDISFEFGGNCPPEISNNKTISNLICVKGANGSGKTNILRALNFFKDFCCDSFSQHPSSPINFDSFFNNPGESEFYINFMIDGISYKYKATITEKIIINEQLFRKNKRETLLFERKLNKVVYFINEFSDIGAIPKLRENASLISTAKQYGMNSIDSIYHFFSHIYTNVAYTGLLADPVDFKQLNEFLFKHEEFLSFVKNVITKFDPAIKDIIIHENENTDQLSGEVKKSYTPLFIFHVDGKTKWLHFGLQSSGTKSLYKQLANYKMALDLGAVLALDEFDINLHPHILPHLLKMFTDNDLNKKNAQLIFSTHNTEILDELGRYRTYLVNKDEVESYSYRLDEIPGDILRNDRPITTAYNLGKIGGVPKL